MHDALDYLSSLERSGVDALIDLALLGVLFARNIQIYYFDQGSVLEKTFIFANAYEKASFLFGGDKVKPIISG